ncbi:MAG: hypothetical protein HXS44_06705 [Theionarchaea archaeon]|nr:hypothetical protein [Theionarchaea archaeon]
MAGAIVTMYLSLFEINKQLHKKREKSPTRGLPSPPFKTGFRAYQSGCTHYRGGVYKSFGYKLTECCKFYEELHILYLSVDEYEDFEEEKL